MYHDPAVASQWKPLLNAGLADDGWPWDWTTQGALGAKAGDKARARIIAKSPGIWCGTSLSLAVEAVARDLGLEIRAKSAFADGQPCRKGEMVCEWKGAARGVLAFERPFLNLASHASGIATETSMLTALVARAWRKVSKGSAPAPRLTLTRKTLPYYRDLGIYAVQCGGGYAHRISLSGGVLIKENHIARAGGIIKAVDGARRLAPHSLRVEVEVRNLDELAEALEAHADIVMLDNFSPALVKKAVKMLETSVSVPLIEISGGLNEKTIESFVLPGVDVLSIGALTHTVKPLDLSLLVD